MKSTCMLSISRAKRKFLDDVFVRIFAKQGFIRQWTTKLYWNVLMSAFMRHQHHMPPLWEQAMMYAAKLLIRMRRLVSDCIANLLQDAACSGHAISWCVSPKINHICHVQRLISPNPTSLEDLVIPQEYQVTLNSHSLLMHDFGDRPDRIRIFSTNEILGKISHYSDWFVDGTFKVTPLLFK